MRKGETFSEYIQRLRPIDNALIRALTIPGPRGRMWVQNVLLIILGWSDLVVLEIVPQADMWIPGIRGAIFDVLATDLKGRKYNLEVQIDPDDATLYSLHSDHWHSMTRVVLLRPDTIKKPGPTCPDCREPGKISV